MTIYEITADCKALESLINEETDSETGELRELSESELSELIAWLEENKQNLETKFNNIYKVYCNKKAEADIAEAEKNALKAEMDRLRKRAEARLNEAGRIKGLIGYALDRLGLKKYKTALFSIGYQATRKTAKPVVGFFNADLIPAEFLKRELSPFAINKAIEEGRLYEKTDNPLNKGKLFYRDENGEQVLKGVTYSGSETLVLR